MTDITCSATVYGRGSQYDRLIGRRCKMGAKYAISRPDQPRTIARHLCGRHIKPYLDNPFWNVNAVKG